MTCAYKLVHMQNIVFLFCCTALLNDIIARSGGCDEPDHGYMIKIALYIYSSIWDGNINKVFYVIILISFLGIKTTKFLVTKICPIQQNTHL